MRLQKNKRKPLLQTYLYVLISPLSHLVMHGRMAFQQKRKTSVSQLKF
ncbi:MAG TPA: DUF2933 domain-containing protein [Thiomicrospira sp.]|nr:DUF2933 domain-containing protein [Thiomicrospira sp.]